MCKLFVVKRISKLVTNNDALRSLPILLNKHRIGKLGLFIPHREEVIHRASVGEVQFRWAPDHASCVVVALETIRTARFDLVQQWLKHAD